MSDDNEETINEPGPEEVKPDNQEERANINNVDTKQPKSLVIKRGKLDATARTLVHDLRSVMSPWCARKLRERKKNNLKDFMAASGVLGVTHVQTVTQTINGTYWRLIKAPVGPAVQLKLLRYTLGKDVRRNVTKNGGRLDMKYAYRYAPICILNGFSTAAKADPQIKLLQTFLLSLFPKLDPKTAEMQKCKRTVFFDYDEGKVHMRHYLVESNDLNGGNVGVKLTDIGPNMDFEVHDIKLEV